MPLDRKISHLLDPLGKFYEPPGLALPRVRSLEGSDVPQPYRQLLVHESDMTSTLEEFFDQSIRLDPLQVREVDDVLYRQVLLRTIDDDLPVEFGAIRIQLHMFDECMQELIREGVIPLGGIMNQHRIEYASKPTDWFSIQPDAIIMKALQLELPQTLFGRHNILTNASGRQYAEVVEILPPIPQP